MTLLAMNEASRAVMEGFLWGAAGFVVLAMLYGLWRGIRWLGARLRGRR